MIRAIGLCAVCRSVLDIATPRFRLSGAVLSRRDSFMRHSRTIVVCLIAVGSLALVWRGGERARTTAADTVSDPMRLGHIVLPNSGSPAAQPSFLRGIAALHSFWYDEAANSFRAALRHDPDFALARWGLAMTFRRPFMPGSDDDAARRELAAIPASSRLTVRERAYVEALQAWLAPGTRGERAAAHAAAWQRVHEQMPDDLEAAAFYALALLGPDWPDDPSATSRRETAAGLAEAILRREPRHPGAAHYLIHSCDDPALATRGLAAARHYAVIAPEAPHALHMPSHIFLHLGLWSEVAASNEAAWAASESWVRREDLNPTQRDYHNLHWLIYACLQQGRFARAAQLLEQFRAMRAELLPEQQFFYQKAAAAYIVETARWDRAEPVFAAAAAVPAAAFPAGGVPAGVELCGVDVPRSTPAGLQPADIPSFIRAFAAAVREQPDAETQLARLRRAAGGDQAMPEFWRIRVLAIQAVQDTQRHRYDTAVAALREATAIEVELGIPPGPPAAYKPPHELLGEILLRAGRPAEATVQFEACLTRHPRRARSLLGHARSLRMRGDHEAALISYRKLLEQWSQADADLDEVREARSYVQSHHG